jgi:AcrR family transcriptional regulator
MAHPARTGIPRDGRAERSERTRRAVADALLELLNEGQLRPSAAEIAERADVGMRTVFHHYQDMEALFRIVADTQLERMAQTARVIPPGPLAGRIDAFVDERARLHEMIAPVRRAALLAEPFSDEIAARLAWVRDRAHREVARVFAPELRQMAQQPRRETAEGITLAASWAAWEALRSHQRLSVSQAKRVVRRMITSLIDEES